MLNSFTCPECKGSRAVAFSHEYKPIADTGLEEWVLIPQSPADDALLAKSLPEAPPAGYRLVYRVENRLWRGRETRVRVLTWEKDTALPMGYPQAEQLDRKSKEELVELAVRKGVTGAEVSWTKARLIGEIEKVGR